MSEETQGITFDLDVEHWTGSKRALYQKVTGSHPMYALNKVEEVFETAQAEADTYAGADDDWYPPSLLNMPERELAGFAWMAARVGVPGLAFGPYADQLDFGEMVTELMRTGLEAAGLSLDGEADTEEPTPLEAEEGSGTPTVPPSPQSETASPSPSSFTGPSTTAESSPSRTSTPRTAKRKPTSTP